VTTGARGVRDQALFSLYPTALFAPPLYAIVELTFFVCESPGAPTQGRQTSTHELLMANTLPRNVSSEDKRRHFKLL